MFAGFSSGLAVISGLVNYIGTHELFADIFLKDRHEFRQIHPSQN